MRPKIVPSVLSADFARLGEEVAALADAGADRLQFDVMDGHHVPNLTFGPAVIGACRPYASCGFEAHLMCERPEELLPRYVDAGCELVIVHPETLRQPHATYQQIRELDARVGIALSPATGIEHLAHALDLVDLVLVMTVNPGFGGQSYLSSMEPKIHAVREMVAAVDRPVEIEVDGGIGPDTIASAAGAGADVFVSGSALHAYGSYKEGIEDLRSKAADAIRA